MLDNIRQEMRKFGETTSMKGVCRTIKAQSLIVRAFWMISLLVCCSLLLYQVITVVECYYSYSVTRNFAVIDSKPNFPDVTICNLFPVSDMQSYDPLYKAYLERLQFVKDQAPDDIKTNNSVWSFYRLLWTFNANIPLAMSNDMIPIPSDDFVVQCDSYSSDLYRPSKCNLFSLLSVPLQVCKTLRPEAYAEGAGISTIVFLDNFYLQAINTFNNWIRVPLSRGIKVLVHPRGVKPNPTMAIYVAPGTELKISLRQYNVTRLPYPYGNCTYQKWIYPNEKDSLPYSQAMCVSLCRQRQYIKSCGCIDMYEYFTNVELQMSNNTMCVNITGLLENSPKYIVNNLLTDEFWKLFHCYWEFVPDEDQCDCQLECFETQYEYSSSSALWPDVYYHLAFYNEYIRSDNRYSKKFAVYENLWSNTKNLSDPEIFEQLQNLKLIEQNFVKITVSMLLKCVKLMSDVPATSWNTMTSNLGGSFNLWLGISILTAAEVIELIYSLLKILLSRQQVQDRKETVSGWKY